MLRREELEQRSKEIIEKTGAFANETKSAIILENNEIYFRSLLGILQNMNGRFYKFMISGDKIVVIGQNDPI